MLCRVAHVRSFRLMAIQRRLYTIKPEGEAAEFTARKNTSATTKYIAAGATILVLGLYGTMAGNPRKAAEVAVENDPEAAANMNPPHGSHEGSLKKR